MSMVLVWHTRTKETAPIFDESATMIFRRALLSAAFFVSASSNSYSGVTEGVAPPEHCGCGDGGQVEEAGMASRAAQRSASFWPISPRKPIIPGTAPAPVAPQWQRKLGGAPSCTRPRPLHSQLKPGIARYAAWRVAGFPPVRPGLVTPVAGAAASCRVPDSQVHGDLHVAGGRACYQLQEHLDSAAHIFLGWMRMEVSAGWELRAITVSPCPRRRYRLGSAVLAPVRRAAPPLPGGRSRR